MSNCKIAIIDSGICLKDPYIINASIVSLDSNGQHICSEDTNMHGTYVTRLITRETQCSVSIVSIKILDASNKGKLKELCKALRLCIDQQVKIINISLGIPECQCTQLSEFIDLCELAKQLGMVIVAAYHNNGTDVYPALLPYVIGIYTSNTQQYPVYVDRNSRNISFSHNYIISLEQASRLIKGNSYLTPTITGLLYMFSINHGLDIDKFLHYVSIEWDHCFQKNYWSNNIHNIKEHTRNRKVSFFSNSITKANTELLAFLDNSERENHVRCVFDLNVSTYMNDDVVFIGDLNLSKKLSINRMYDFTYSLASSGKDIVMFTPYISMWDRIAITRKCKSKLISLYF